MYTHDGRPRDNGAMDARAVHANLPKASVHALHPHPNTAGTPTEEPGWAPLGPSAKGKLRTWERRGSLVYRTCLKGRQFQRKKKPLEFWFFSFLGGAAWDDLGGGRAFSLESCVPAVSWAGEVEARSSDKLW